MISIEDPGVHALARSPSWVREARWSAAPLIGIVIVTLTLACGCGIADSPPAADPPVRSLELQPGELAIAVVSTHCGYEWLEVVINGETWMTTELSSDSAGNPAEPAWPQGQQAAELELTLVEEDQLHVTAVGTNVTHTYELAPRPAGCE